MTHPKPVMLPENDPPPTKSLTLRLPVDLLNRAKIQADRDLQEQGETVDVTDWIVQLIATNLSQEPELDQLSLSPDEPEDDLDRHRGGASFGASLMIAPGADPDHDLGQDLGNALNNNLNSDRQITGTELGESVAMAQVKTYVSDYVSNYVNGYVQPQIQQQVTSQVQNRLEILEQFTAEQQRQLQAQLHQHQAQHQTKFTSLTSLQDNLQNQVNTLQQQLSYCLGE
ncbi:MAG: hypothetical protein WCO45_01075 [Pseudanabaena sp. ELA607]|jgi:flagellar capping protein FliD